MIYSMTDGLMSWQLRIMASNAQLRVTRSASYYHNSMTRPLSQYRQSTKLLTSPTDHHIDGTYHLLMTNTSPHHSAIGAGRQQPRATPTTYARTWTIELVKQDQSMDQAAVLQRERTAVRPGATSTTSLRPKIAYGLHPNCVATSPDTEAPHTPYASPMR